MHKYIVTRGKSIYVDQWKHDMESQFLNLNLKGYDNKPLPPSIVQLVMRPIQLWELVYPEEHDQRVLGLIGEPRYDKYKVFMKLKTFFCRLLGLQITEKGESLMNKPIPRSHVGVHILGNKPDIKDIHGNEML